MSERQPASHAVAAPYAEAAQRLGMCKSHVTHMMALLQLAADIQEAILDRRLAITERQLRPTCRAVSWEAQHIDLRTRHDN